MSFLPPGVNASDIPGNRPEDVAWDRLHEWIDDTFADDCPDDLRRLIAAAPDLLEALRDLAHSCTLTSIAQVAAHDRALAAITKAEGNE